jgi:hypothetical protein
MFSNYLTLLLAVATTTFAQAPPASKTEWAPAPGGLGAVLNGGTNGGLNGLPHSPYTKTKWAWGKLPQHCYDKAVHDGKCDVYQVEAYDIQYDDVSSSPYQLQRTSVESASYYISLARLES